ncbi:MAG: DMSO/selenate family reductase complex B subunit [Bacillota bacterium]
MKKQYAFFYDSSNCSGCKACQAACKDKNNLEVGVLWRRVYEVNSGGWTKRGDAWINEVKAYNISVSCNHCEDPLCVKNCPTNAMHKRKDGVVLVDEKKCIGCRYCEWACPYGAPQYDEKIGVMSKCTMCEDYIEEEKSPACVAACPMRALDFGEKKEIQKKYGTESEFYPLPSSDMTKPSVVIKAHKDASSTDDSNAWINNKEEV